MSANAGVFSEKNCYYFFTEERHQPKFLLCVTNLPQVVCSQLTVAIMQNLTISTLFHPMSTTKKLFHLALPLTIFSS